MNLNFRRYSNTINKNVVSSLMQPGKSLLELIAEIFEKPSETDFDAYIDVIKAIDPKKTPEGSKGLTAWDSVNPNGIPEVIFSDGGGFGYCDYRKLQRADNEGAKGFCKLIDKLLADGRYELVTMYKPDGMAFETYQPKRPPVEAIQSKKLRNAAQKALSL